MKFWMWRWPTLSFGIAMLMALLDHNVPLMLVLLMGAIGTAWLRKEVNYEVDRIIREIEDARPIPAISMAAFFKDGFDFKTQHPQAVYEVQTNPKGKDEILVGEYISQYGSKERAFIPHWRIGHDYFFNELEKLYKSSPKLPAAPAKH